MINILTTNTTGIDIPKSIEARFDGDHDFRKTVSYDSLTLDQKLIFDSFISIINDVEVTYLNVVNYAIYLDVNINKSISNSRIEVEFADIQQADLDVIINFTNMVIQL